MMLAYVFQQTVSRVFHHIQHALKAIRTSKIRIGNFKFTVVICKLEE
jgi:hypothetical protein